MDNTINSTSANYVYRMIFYQAQSPNPPVRLDPTTDLDYAYTGYGGYPPSYTVFYYQVTGTVEAEDGGQIPGLFGVTQRRPIASEDEEDWELAPGTYQYNPVWVP